MSLLLLFQQAAAGGGGGGGDDWSLKTFWRRLVRMFAPRVKAAPHMVVPHRVGPFMVE